MSTKPVGKGSGQVKIRSRRQEAGLKAGILSKKLHIHFSKQECERLLQLYKQFTISQAAELKTNKKGIDRSKFRDILHQYFDITNDIIMDKIFKVFDSDNDGLVSANEWVTGMSVFLRGTLEEHSKYCFGVYCYQGDKQPLTREDMFQLLKHCMVHVVTEEDPDECPKELVEFCLKKMDLDRDGRLSIDDYVKSVYNENLLVEVLGACLPKEQAKESFMMMIADDKVHASHH